MQASSSVLSSRRSVHHRRQTAPLSSCAPTRVAPLHQRRPHSRAAPMASSSSSTLPPPPVVTIGPAAPGGAPTHISYRNLSVQTAPASVSVVNLTPAINQEIAAVGLRDGWVNVLSRHTTTALTINENEPRLVDDLRQWLRKVAPPSDPYLHNDMHLREAPPNWPGGWEAWAKQEPINAHSHLLSMLLGNTLTIPVTEGKLAIGTWQSVLLVELDGPRPRTVGVQLVGHTAATAASAPQ